MKYATPWDRVRAWSITEPGGCWSWRGSFNNVGRPRISVRIKGKRAQWVTVARYVCQFVSDEGWNRRSVGKHSCHHGWCTNPDHITRGTQKQNVRECVAAGRHVSGFDKSRYRRENVIAPK